jgi:hypothetical protein
VVDQDPPHDAGGDAEELGAVAPVDAALIHEAQIGLVDEGGRLESVARGFPTQAAGRESVQLLVDHGQHLIEGRLVALAPVQQPLGDGA